MIAKQDEIIAGIDTHADTHHVALIDNFGKKIADREFPANGVGYRKIEKFITGQGPVVAVGVEQTGSYGAEICRHLQRASLHVVEVSCVDRRGRRLHGKSDPIDAYAAAEAVLGQRSNRLS